MGGGDPEYFVGWGDPIMGWGDPKHTRGDPKCVGRGDPIMGDPIMEGGEPQLHGVGGPQIYGGDPRCVGWGRPIMGCGDPKCFVG